MNAAIFLSGYAGMSSAMAYIGMLFILSAFVFETRGRLDSHAPVYLWMMIVGSALLAIRAAHMGEWAFLILEAVWCLAATVGLLRPHHPVAGEPRP